MLRDRYLIALALGISPADKAAHQAVGTSIGLRPAVLARHFALPGSKAPSESRVMHLLAWKQLQKAHEIEIPLTEDFKPKSVLKATLLKGQKGDEPVKMLAAQVTKAQSNKLQHVRDAVLRHWAAQQPVVSLAVPATEPSTNLNLQNFAGRVRELAQTSSTGKFGDNKVFLSHVWQRFQSEGGNGMSRAEFDRRLVEANQENLLTLSRADLIGAMNPEDVSESEIRLSNSTFHFIRTDR
jgi:hypothetical protein